MLAVADLSAELYYHGHLELLPRLGRSWQELVTQMPDLRLWHNGGGAPWMKEALRLLGVPAERQLCAKKHPRLRADLLLVPGFSCPFGQPGQVSLMWLRQFWKTVIRELPYENDANRWLLLRSSQQRRPLLQHHRWRTILKNDGWIPLKSEASVLEQLQSLSQANEVIAVHGVAMTNLLLAPAGATVIELANPDYTPPYFHSLIRSGRMKHKRRL